MLFVVFYDSDEHLNSVNDFRTLKLKSAITRFGAKSLEIKVSLETVDLSSFDADSDQRTFHIVSFCSSLKDLTRAINCLAKHCDEVFREPVKFILVQDLIVTERHYIYSNYEANFFGNFLKISTKYFYIEPSITNSNTMTNSWGEGDTSICSIAEIEDNTEQFWESIKANVVFHEMFNQGNAVPRLVSIQSVQEAGLGRPLYRHPNDEEPPNEEMVPAVLKLMRLVEQHTGVSGLNHALIQHYRHGRDNIAAHSDKTLDIDPHTPIINLSLGADRTMSIQNKDNKEVIEKIPLRHGQCVVFGLRTNRFWFHEVPKDMHISPHPLFGQERISFTFRKINTFVDAQGVVVGQGSPFKTPQQVPHPLPECTRTRADLIRAFGAENRQSAQFDWDAVYGQGFLIR